MTACLLNCEADFLTCYCRVSVDETRPSGHPQPEEWCCLVAEFRRSHLLSHLLAALIAVKLIITSSPKRKRGQAWQSPFPASMAAG